HRPLSRCRSEELLYRVYDFATDRNLAGPLPGCSPRLLGWFLPLFLCPVIPLFGSIPPNPPERISFWRVSTAGLRRQSHALYGLEHSGRLRRRCDSLSGYTVTLRAFLEELAGCCGWRLDWAVSPCAVQPPQRLSNSHRILEPVYR